MSSVTVGAPTVSSKQNDVGKGTSPARGRKAALDVTLDEVGVRHGTRLSSTGRDCLAVWEPLLAPLRNERFDLLDIGVGAGASLRTWREWFPRARLVGFDARRILLDPLIPGCHLFQGCQTNLIAMQPLLREYRFRVVIADGSLHDDDQIHTFTMLFPWLEPASLYLCAGFNAGGDPARYDASAWFADLGTAVMSPAARERAVRKHPDLEPIVPQVKSVLFGRGSVLVVREL